MIGHAVDNLTQAQEDAFLLSRLVPWERISATGGHCWLGVLDTVCGGGMSWHYPQLLKKSAFSTWVFTGDWVIAAQFNAICERLGGLRPRYNTGKPALVEDGYYKRGEAGAAKLGVMIRNRILANRAKRLLGAQREALVAAR